MDKAFSDMDRFVEEDTETKTTPPPPGKKPPAKTPPKAPEKPPKQEETPPVEEEEAEQQEQELPDKGKVKDEDGKAPKGQKLKPWDLVERYKTKATTLEKEVAELRSKVNGTTVPKEALEKITTLETRNKELEDEIRFTKYEKSKDYQDNYQKPYVEAWQKALGELKELTITESDGRTRQGNADDLLMLAQLPLGKARQLANQWFGDAADDMMAHRRAIRELSDKQHKALEEARTHGGEREKQAALEQQAKDEASSKAMAQAWATINEEHVKKYDFLRPVEGETERNEKLEKAIKFVDESFALSVHGAKTEQERQDVLRRHAALRNRAIGFAVVKHENKALKAKLAEVEKALAEFKESEPTAGEAGHDKSRSMVTNPMEHAMQSLADLAE